jgi:hypothetical protein
MSKKRKFELLLDPDHIDDDGRDQNQAKRERFMKMNEIQPNYKPTVDEVIEIYHSLSVFSINPIHFMSNEEIKVISSTSLCDLVDSAPETISTELVQKMHASATAHIKYRTQTISNFSVQLGETEKNPTTTDNKNEKKEKKKKKEVTDEDAFQVYVENWDKPGWCSSSTNVDALEHMKNSCSFRRFLFAKGIGRTRVSVFVMRLNLGMLLYTGLFLF